MINFLKNYRSQSLFIAKKIDFSYRFQAQDNFIYYVNENDMLGKAMYNLSSILEYPIHLLIKKIIKEYWVCVEIGANYGNIALEMALNIGKKGFVYAYEPGSTFSYLDINCKINAFNKIIKTRKKIISNTLGEGNMLSLNTVSSSHSEIVAYQEEINNINNIECSFYNFASLHTTFKKKQNTVSFFMYDILLYNFFCSLGLIYEYKLDITTLDDELQDTKKVNFVRFDVEGYECKVLKGAYQIINKNSDIILSFEWQPSLIKSQEKQNNNEKLQNCLNVFLNLGFVKFSCLQGDNYTIGTAIFKTTEHIELPLIQVSINDIYNDNFINEFECFTKKGYYQYISENVNEDNISTN